MILLQIQVPDVHVTDDPGVVVLFAGLFATVVVLALMFALPRFSRPPATADPSEPVQSTSAAETQPKSVWSTAPADATPPWRARGRKPPAEP